LISENLARLHQYSVGFDFLPQNKERYNYSNWFIDFNKKATKLLQLCNQIYNTLDYDPLYYSIYSIYHDHKHIINKCLNLLSTANCKQLMMQAIVDNTFCHLDYVNKNLYLADQKVYMIDFDRTKLDITIHDLSSLLRRVLRRKSIQWDFEIAQLMIDSYRSIQPLSKNELKAILAYVIFPQKFFTELKRYVKDQSNTLYYTERFHKIAQQYKNKDLFISQFENYYNINKDMKYNHVPIHCFYLF
jgi:CotS family spore coat protein